jgi:acetate kinase
LEHLGISLDEKKNASADSGIAEVQKDGAPVKVLVIRTDEEWEIARQTVRTIENAGGRRNLSAER